jgi:hypothetical protein
MAKRLLTTTVFALLLVAAPAFATGPLRTLRAPAQHVLGYEPATGWERAAAPPSSRLLASWTHHDGGKLTFVAERSSGKQTSQQIYEANKALLEKQGWTIGKSETKGTRTLVEATLDKGKRFARQLYIVEEGFAYVITLVAPIEQRDERTREFDDAVTAMKLGSGEGDQK